MNIAANFICLPSSSKNYLVQQFDPIYEKA
jgi:hypothetical protein